MRLTDISRANDLAQRLVNRQALHKRIEEGTVRAAIGAGPNLEELVLTPKFAEALKRSALKGVQYEIDDITRELAGMGVETGGAA